MSELMDKVERGESLSDSEFKGFIAEKRAFAEIAMRLGMHNAVEKYVHDLDMLEKELDWGEKYYG